MAVAGEHLSFSRCVNRPTRRPGRSRSIFRKTSRSGKRAYQPANRPLLTRGRTTNLGPFGEVLRATGPMAKANPFRFSTKYQDDESDLLYYGYRYLNTSTGRWLSRDPMGENGGVNLYEYVINNPIRFTDPFGLAGQTFIGGMGMGFGGFPVYQPPSPPAAPPQPGNPTIYGLGWLFGLSPDVQLGPDSAWTQAMQSGPSRVMDIDRDRTRAALAKYCTPTTGVVSLSKIPLGGELGGQPDSVPAMRYITSVLPSEYVYNPVAAFIGGWTGGNITIVRVNCCKRVATIHIHGINVSGLRSATHLPPLFGGYGPSVLNDSPFSWGSAHNITQTFDWNENIGF